MLTDDALFIGFIILNIAMIFCIYLLIKNTIYINQSSYEINNYLNYEKITINKVLKYSYSYNNNNIIKINNHRFTLIYIGYDYEYDYDDKDDLFLVIFDINEPPDSTLFIRYYKIPFKLYNF